MNHPQKSRPALPDWLVLNANFVLLWCGYGVAAFGDHLSEIALLRERDALNRPDSTRVQALITFGFFLPFVLLGPLAGWWSDRFSRKFTMIAADVLRAVLVFNLGLIVPPLARWLEPHGYGDFSIVLPLAAVGLLAAFFSPARQALLPTLIRDNQLVRANAMINALGTIGAILSAVVGGQLVQRLGPTVNYQLNAATFLLSAVFVFLISMRRSRSVPHPPLEGVWSPLRDGFRYVGTHRRVLQLILLGMVFWAAAGAVISIVPALVKVYFQEDYSAAGTFRGIIAAGLAVGAAVMTIVGPSLPTQLAVLIALAAAGGWLIALNVAHVLQLGKLLTGVALFGIGGAGAALLVTIMANIQRFVPDVRRGRVFGVSDMCTMGAMVLATGLLGVPRIPNLDTLIPYILGVTALGFFVATVVAWRLYRRGDRLAGVTRCLWWMVRGYALFWCRLKRVGPCTIPPRGPAIVAANHGSGLDPIGILACSPHRLISYLVAEEYYRVWGAKWLMDRVECIPIDRKNPGKSFLVNCLRTLKEGRCLGIFPQGTFEEPGKPIPPAKPGVALLALRTGAPVIPVHVSGTRYFDNPFLAYVFRHRMRIRFGPPVDLSAFAGKEKDEAALEAASAAIMAAIQALQAEPPAASRETH